MHKKVVRILCLTKPAICIALIIICGLTRSGEIMAQEINDTIPEIELKEKRTSIFTGKPGRSMLYSLILPGSGQLYNKSYLRVPFVYAAVGTAGYVMINNTRIYNCRRDKYISLIDGTVFVPTNNCKDCNNIKDFTDPTRVRNLRDQANKRRQQSIVIFSLVWLANGVDAFVDAHLKDFDIDEDLSVDFKLIQDESLLSSSRVGVVVQF